MEGGGMEGGDEGKETIASELLFWHDFVRCRRAVFTHPPHSNNTPLPSFHPPLLRPIHHTLSDTASLKSRRLTSASRPLTATAAPTLRNPTEAALVARALVAMAAGVRGGARAGRRRAAAVAAAAVWATAAAGAMTMATKMGMTSPMMKTLTWMCKE